VLETVGHTLWAVGLSEAVLAVSVSSPSIGVTVFTILPAGWVPMGVRPIYQDADVTRYLYGHSDCPSMRPLQHPGVDRAVFTIRDWMWWRHA
jgi:hypothetical protein